MTTFHTWSNASNTYATILVWDEKEFRYREVVDSVLDRNAEEDYRKIHDPPLVIVKRISYV